MRKKISKREEWYNKWLQKKLTGRAIIELKDIDKKVQKRLKEKIPNKLIIKLLEMEKDITTHKIINQIFQEEYGGSREKGYEKAKKGLNKLKKSWGRAY